MSSEDESSLIYPLLESPDFFNLDRKSATDIKSRSRQLQSVPSIIMLIVGGLIFDILGRKWPLFIIFMGEGLVLASYPWMAPNTTYWIIMTMMYDVFKRPKKANPLI